MLTRYMQHLIEGAIRDADIVDSELYYYFDRIEIDLSKGKVLLMSGENAVSITEFSRVGLKDIIVLNGDFKSKLGLAFKDE